METLPKQLIIQLKTAILQSRYQAVRLANREQLLLYLFIGARIEYEAKQSAWGSKVLQTISEQLQSELQGLRGFSPENLKKMRVFAKFWINSLFQTPIGSMLPNQLVFLDEYSENQYSIFENNITTVIGSMVSNQLIQCFFSVGFSHHYAIASVSQTIEEAFFYLQRTANEFWSYQTLQKQLKAKLFQTQGTLPNNFTNTLSSILNNKAVQVFKDEYLFDFINIEDPDDEDERLIESEIVRNIKQFIMTIGQGFAFMGNQYRLKVEEQEYFIDLLFYNRNLQALVVFELKNGVFKPEYLGKMNFYLSALDDLVRQPHENPSIGIILCKEKKNAVVEYSFRDFSKPMGVATFTTSTQLPEKYKGILPEPEALIKLLDK
jgi:predicted nuclease of restriction endonuclease-like (RecB) superfamily